jgi:hypothetical protein
MRSDPVLQIVIEEASEAANILATVSNVHLITIVIGCVVNRNRIETSIAKRLSCKKFMCMFKQVNKLY